MRILLATVGQRDPGTPEAPTGPRRAANELRPEEVVLLATEDVARQADELRESIQASLPGVAVHVELAERLRPGVPNLPVLLGELLYVGREVVRRYPELTDASNEVDVCATSGTPQISTALTLVARSLLPNARHYQALDPSKASGGTLLVPFDPDILVRLDARDRLFDRLAAGDGAGALAAGHGLDRVASPPWNAKAVRTALELARGLEYVAAFQRSELKTLSFPQQKNAPDEVRLRLDGARQWFARCVNDDKAWAVELGAHALRVLGLGNPTGAVIAAAIATEAMTTAGIRLHGEIDPDGVSALEKLPEPLRERARAVGQAPEYYRVEGLATGAAAPSAPMVGQAPAYYRVEGGRDRSLLLKEVCRGYRAAFDELEPIRERIAEARNKAVHRGAAAERAIADEVAPFLDRLAEAVGFDGPASVPTAPERLGALAEALRKLS